MLKPSNSWTLFLAACLLCEAVYEFSKGIMQFICNILHANGWNIFDPPSAALSFKMYDSAVGKKETQVYFSGDQFNWCLSGLYQSHGRNILKTESVLIPKDCSIHQLSAFCLKFVQNVELVIANSYAVRLL
jgi:hypothetical protein